MAEPPPDGEGGSSNNKGKEKVVPEYGKNRHGMPVGYYFVPKDLQLLAILKCKLVHGDLPGALNGVFEQIRILDFHPALLHRTYVEKEEDGYIYFFSTREFVTKAGNKKRPVRVANGGTWKASGGSKTVRSKKLNVGQKLTMVFYERRFDGDKSPVKTNWGMHEFTKIIPGSKNQLEDLAVYRLYMIKKKEDAVKPAAAAPSTDEPSTSAGTAESSPPPQPLPGLAGSLPAMALPSPPPLPGLAGSSSAMALTLPSPLPGLAGTSSAMALPGLAGSSSAMGLPLPLPGLAGTSSAMAPPPPLRGLAGGMMSMANQANVASTSQPYAASQTGIELMQDWNLFAYSGARAAPPFPGTTSSLALPSSPPPGRSSPNGPVQHLAMMEDPTAWLMEPLLMPIAAVSLEPMAPPTHSTGQNSPAPPAVDRQYSPLHGAENYNQHELVDCGVVQAQHEHHQQEPQAVVVDSADGYGATADGDAQMGSPLPPATGPEFHDSLCDLVDGTLLLELGDGIYIDFNDIFSDDETAPAPTMIDGSGSGEGDAADGGDGGSQPHGDQCNGSQEQQDPCNN